MQAKRFAFKQEKFKTTNEHIYTKANSHSQKHLQRDELLWYQNQSQN